MFARLRFIPSIPRHKLPDRLKPAFLIGLKFRRARPNHPVMGIWHTGRLNFSPASQPWGSRCARLDGVAVENFARQRHKALLPSFRALNRPSNVCVSVTGQGWPLEPWLAAREGGTCRQADPFSRLWFPLMSCSTWCLISDLSCKARFPFSSRLYPVGVFQGPCHPNFKKKFDVGFRISNFDFCKGHALGVASPIPLCSAVCQTMSTFPPPTAPFCITGPLLRV